MYAAVRRLLNELAADAGLADSGQPIRFTPHDFRRLFTTQMLSSGLPLHIATLLGHLNLDTPRLHRRIPTRCSPRTSTSSSAAAPYGTPCVHEHACSRCRSSASTQRNSRIEEMIRNAEAHLAEAQDRAWLGEVAALEESLKHLRQRRAEAENQLTAVGVRRR